MKKIKKIFCCIFQTKCIWTETELIAVNYQ